jgi:hypothetical protein
MLSALIALPFFHSLTGCAFLFLSKGKNNCMEEHLEEPLLHFLHCPSAQCVKQRVILLYDRTSSPELELYGRIHKLHLFITESKMATFLQTAKWPLFLQTLKSHKT